MSLPTIGSAAPLSLAARAVRYGLHRLRQQAPRYFNVSEPVVQLFVNDWGKRTTYTFLDFPSLYSPDTAAPCHYELTLFDAAGRVAGRGRVDVPAFGAVAVRLDQVMRGPLPPLGLLAARIRSNRLLSYADRHLGTVTSHFYAMYHDDAMDSVSIIHPQTALWGQVPDPEPWRSNMLIAPAPLRHIEVFQVNPTRATRQTTLTLRAPDGAVLAAAPATLAAHGARRVLWEAAGLTSHPHVTIASDDLTAPNAKPLVFLTFQTGAFSAAHS